MGMHHHDSGAEASGIAAWMMATVLLVVAGVVVVIALLVWSPWTDGTVDSPPADVPEEQAPGETDIDIEGDINVDDGGGQDQQDSNGQ